MLRNGEKYCGCKQRCEVRPPRPYRPKRCELPARTVSFYAEVDTRLVLCFGEQWESEG